MNRKYKTALLCFGFFFSLPLQSTAGNYFSVKVPNPIEWGAIVPINVNFSDESSITNLTVDVPTNPQGFQRAISIDIPKAKTTQISMRIRVSGTGKKRLIITGTDLSGAILDEEELEVVVLKKSNTDFSEPATLSVSAFESATKTNLAPVGSIAVRAAKASDSHVKISTILKHPNIPNGMRLRRVTLTEGKKKLLNAVLGSAYASDPYLAITLKRQSTPSGSYVAWDDNDTYIKEY